MSVLNKKLIRDAAGSPVPQFYDEEQGIFIAVTNGTGDPANIDFRKIKMIRDALGSPIPQYYDVEQGKFVPSTNESSNQRAYINTIESYGVPITDFSDVQLWYGDGETDIENVKQGFKSFKLTTNAGNQTAACRLQNTAYLLGSDAKLLIRFYIHDLETFSNIQIRFSNVSNLSSYLQYRISRWICVEGWNEILIPISDFTKSGEIELNEPILTTQFSVGANNAGEVSAVTFDVLTMHHKQKAKVMLHFDDAYKSVFTDAAPYMRNHGFVGNVGVISDVVGTGSYMTLADLQTLYGREWDMFNHTSNHLSMITQTPQEALAAANECRQWLERQGMTRAANLIAYPYGDHNAMVVEMLKKNGYKQGRTVNEYLNKAPAINDFELRCVNLINNVTSATWEKAINDAIATGATLIFLMHDIRVGSNEMYLDPAKFKAMIDYLVSKKEEIEIMSWSNWYHKYKF
ncbi:hypothetical protein A0U40_18205 [[Bacillus] sp. KCTC 13219]|nr:hypothetical protein A0U40_18205 [[Bacillus] sp. KCTC 13219]